MSPSSLSRRQLFSAGAAVGVTALGACAASTLASADRAATVILVRHAEKRRDEDDPRLTAAGARRADRLAAWLAAAGVTRIYSTPYRRTRATVEPLATRLGVEVTSYEPKSPDAFAARLAASESPGVVLVTGHSNTIPQIVRALGGSLQGLDDNGNLSDDDYDRVVVQTLFSAATDEPLRAIQTLDLRMPNSP